MPRVLLIEDDRAVREGVALALRRQGHDVAAAATGEDGMAHLTSFRPDVVVLDLMLPGMTGLDVCRGIRSVDQTLPIVMATARGDDVDIVVGLEAGADDYVVKPVQAGVLNARIRAVAMTIGRV
ncbi:response regulator, partial [Streptomyces sp. S3(2020)]|uniref:response regulator transcription factor n=1 Tax=Streptomyces sp. S3(2020) TaxID=2732044 RepID=UPI00148968D8